MGQEISEQPNSPGEILDSRENSIPFPHGEAALKAFEKTFPNNPDKVAAMKRVLDVFFQQEMDNTRIFTDESGAILPYTRINITEFARALTGISSASQQVETETPKHKKVFIVPSFPALQNGHQFTFVEFAMKQAVKYLPQVARDLQEGKTPPDIEVYTLGSPTNKKWGEVTPEYVGRLEKDAYGTLSKTYSGFAEQQLPRNKEARVKTALVFIGDSMAGSMAAGAVENLITSGVATQESLKRQEGLPFVQVIMDAPVTINPSKHRQRALMPGFVIDSLHALATSSHLRKTALRERKFLESLEPVLAERGINSHEGKAEIKLKRRGHKAVIDAMYNKKMTVDASKVRVNIRRGMYDLTIPPFEFARRARNKLRSYREKGGRVPIGKYLIPDTKLDVINANGRNAREFAVRGTHIFPIIFTEKEMRRWGKTLDRLSPISPA